MTIESVDPRSRGNDFRRGTRTPCLESLSRQPCEPRADIAHREPHGPERHVGAGPGDGGPPKRPRRPRDPRMVRTVQPTLPAGQLALSNWTTRPVQSDRTDSPNLVNELCPIRGPSDSQSRPKVSKNRARCFRRRISLSTNQHGTELSGDGRATR